MLTVRVEGLPMVGWLRSQFNVYTYQGVGWVRVRATKRHDDVGLTFVRSKTLTIAKRM